MIFLLKLLSAIFFRTNTYPLSDRSSNISSPTLLCSIPELLLLFFLSHLATPFFLPKLQAQSPALNALNQAFLQNLKAKLSTKATQQGPLFIYRHQRIELMRVNQPTVEKSIEPPKLYQELKSYSHLILLSSLLLQDFQATPTLLNQLNEQLPLLKQVVIDAKAIRFQDQLQSQERPPLLFIAQDPRFEQGAVIERQERIALATVKLFETLIQQFSQLDQAQVQKYLKAYVYEINPLIELNIKHCAYLHLTVIHQQAQALYQLLSEEEKRTVQAIGYGSKGPRSKSLGLQYMAWLLGTQGENERIIYFEGRFEDKDILNALAKFNLELQLSTTIDQDPLYLQSDILGEDATKILKQLDSIKP